MLVLCSPFFGWYVSTVTIYYTPPGCACGHRRVDDPPRSDALLCDWPSTWIPDEQVSFKNWAQNYWYSEKVLTSPLAKLTEKVCPSSSLGTTTAPASCWLLRHRPFLKVHHCLSRFLLKLSMIQLTYPQADGTLACQLRAPGQTICIATPSPHWWTLTAETGQI